MVAKYAFLGAVLAVCVYFIRLWLQGCTCAEVADLRGKNVIITGGTGGIGMEAAKILYGMGANVILPVRNTTKAKPFLYWSQQQNISGSVTVETMDLSDIASVTKFVGKLKAKKVHILINNAGVWPHHHKETKDNLQEIFQTNHLSHFLLTTLLLPNLRAAGQDKGGGPARVITLSSNLHYRGNLSWNELKDGKVMPSDNYEPFQAYSNSKLANALFAKELHRRLNASSSYKGLVTSTSVHPGVIVTELHREDKTHRPWFYALYWTVVSLVGKNVHQGAQTTIYAAISKDAANLSGSYLADCAAKPPHPEVEVEENGVKLWQMSVGLLQKLKAPVRKIPV